VAERELDGRRASAGVPEHGGALDAERIEEQRVRVRLVRGHGRGGQGRSQVSEARRGDEPVTGADVGLREAGHHVKAPEERVAEDHRRALAPCCVLDVPEKRVAQDATLTRHDHGLRGSQRPRLPSPRRRRARRHHRSTSTGPTPGGLNQWERKALGLSEERIKLAYGISTIRDRG
jgi:hypothetical protein